jgi:hypothetical protein
VLDVHARASVLLSSCEKQRRHFISSLETSIVAPQTDNLVPLYDVRAEYKSLSIDCYTQSFRLANAEKYSRGMGVARCSRSSSGSPAGVVLVSSAHQH